MLDFFKVIFGITIVIISIYISLLILEKFVTKKTINIKVSFIEKKIDKKGEISFRIYTKTEIFENKDNYFHGKQNAHALSKILKDGKYYTVKVVGYKFGVKLPYFIERRNILNIITNKKIPLK